jgi:hypothetical protein
MSEIYREVSVECGQGWEKLYRPLIDMAVELNIDVVQVKEKFGGLRFYVNRNDVVLDKMIMEAENKSFDICELCGEGAKRRNLNNWIVTLCDSCYNKENKNG